MTTDLHKRFFTLGTAIAFCLLFTQGGFAQKDPSPPTRILLVFDASQSMYGLWEGESKINIATRLLNELVDSISNYENVQMALRVYGHQNPVVAGSRNCKDTKLEVPFGPTNHEKIKSRLSSIQPKGTTLIAYSLQKAADDFNNCADCRNVVILITDGIEECDGDPCAVSLALQRKGVILKPFVIGLGLDKSLLEQFQCIGNFYDVNNQKEFRTVLGIIISQAVNTTSVQVNLLDTYGNPTETNVGMTFYDQHSGAVRYNFVHTLNHYGVPDTLPIDPLGNYVLQVHTTPEVRKDSITLQPGIHNIVAVDAPQGELVMKTLGLNEYKDLKAIVRKAGSMETLTIQDFDEKRKYLVGKYDLEILSLPRLHQKNIDISQSTTTKIEIPQPGIASFTFSSNIIASVYEEKGDELNLIYTFKKNSSRSSLVMQPGKYRIISRPLNSKSAVYSQEESFEVVSGQSVQIKL